MLAALGYAAILGTATVLALTVIQVVRLRRAGNKWEESVTTASVMWLPNTLWVALLLFFFAGCAVTLFSDRAVAVEELITWALLSAIPLAALNQWLKNTTTKAKRPLTLALIVVLPILLGILTATAS